eukprot:COSAG03_NODE_259_length_9809_cov_57.854686_4_plen_60_part_00
MRGAGSPDSDVTTRDVAACQGSAAGAGRPVQQDLGRRGGRSAAYIGPRGAAGTSWSVHR